MGKNIRSMFRVYAYEHNVFDDDTYMLQDYVLDERLDRGVLNDKIMLDIGERYSYWSHSLLLKRAIDNWFIVHRDNISKLIDTTEYEFDALHLKSELGKNFTETFNEDVDSTRTDNLKEEFSENTENLKTNNLQELQTNNLTEQRSNTESTTSSTDSSGSTLDVAEISAYDSPNYQPQNKTTETTSAETDVTTTTTSTGTTSNTGTVNTANTGTVRDNEDKENELTKTGTVRNVTDKDNQLQHYEQINGTDTNKDYADNVRKERELALFNVYDWITDALAEEICLAIF